MYAFQCYEPPSEYMPLLYWCLQLGYDNNFELFIKLFQHPQCYELASEYMPLVLWCRWCLEGVLVVLVGVFGLVGNAITVAVLAMMTNNTNASFNKLLIG